MKNPFKELSEEDKRKALNKMLWTFGLTVFLIGSFWAIYTWKTNEKLNYTFILDGEEMGSIMVCEDQWNYEDLDFLPCVINETFGGLFPQTINWSLSPQENCHFWGGEFTGFNVYNETRAKELYDLVLPKCFELKDEEVSYIWLNASGCICLMGNETLEFQQNCEEYVCAGGLIVKRK